MLQLTPQIIFAFENAIATLSKYLSIYVAVLNKYISVIGNLSTLKNERTMLIKHVKKLRFFNDCIVRFNVQEEAGKGNLDELVTTIGSFFIKYIEIMDLLNYYSTQTLQSEIKVKTMNPKLMISEEAINAAQDTYNHFVKFTQWMVESTGTDSTLLQMEVIQFNLKIAIEDQVDLEETENIFLQEILPVNNEHEYISYFNEWLNILQDKVAYLNQEFHFSSAQWQEVNNFTKKK